MYSEITNYLEVLKTEYDLIEDSRKEILIKLSRYIENKVQIGEIINLIFICTHNSRRSQTARIWAQSLANYYNLTNINCYSGGTEVTAFYPSAVGAFRQIGFQIEKSNGDDNPIYIIKFSDNSNPIHAFSMVYDDPSNPNKEFAAVMTCSDADRNCPIIPNAVARFAITYNDPRQYDGSGNEQEKYDESCRLIGREMMYVFSKVRE